MCKCRRKINVDIINEEVKGSIIEVEGFGKRKCRIKSHVYIINDEMKESSSEEEGIGIRNCRKISQVDIINEEVKVWTSPLKQKEAPPEPTNTKEEICLEQMKKIKIATLEWDDFVLQEQLKSLM